MAAIMTRQILRYLALSVFLSLSISVGATETESGAESARTFIAIDSVLILAAGALVFFMQAGFALLESGMSRSKNAVNVIIKNYSDVCFGSIIFFAVGYGIMFGTNSTGFFGTDLFFLSGVDKIDYNLVFFQTMFAATAATIVSGAMAERTQLRSYLLGAICIIGFIYPIYGSWAWNEGGWLYNKGFIDFAGSTTVHSIGGWCALAGVIVVGPRLGRFDKYNNTMRVIPGHSVTLVALGGFILWFGWFGFNAGSIINATTDIGTILTNTHLGACAGAVGAALAMALKRTKLLATMIINGSLGGLVSITAGCATMSPIYAIVTGLVAGFLVVKSDDILARLHVDDVVSAVSVHGVAGAWGTIAAGLFIAGDLFNIDQVYVQAIGVVAGFLWSFPIAFIVFTVIKLFFGLRSPTIHEQRGLDYSEHGEKGYPEFTQSQLHRETE